MTTRYGYVELTFNPSDAPAQTLYVQGDERVAQELRDEFGQLDPGSARWVQASTAPGAPPFSMLLRVGRVSQIRFNDEAPDE